ncbi:MAG TPA: ABC transporter substrate-binding protein [Solirubrobacteraceae bacterium]|nr:ABC transporter substrate-binding protein [Solirubrobacteraceae bacterium]
MRQALRAAAAALILGIGVAACGGAGVAATGAAGAGSAARSGRVSADPINGGTAYFAEQPLSPPNYIFPLISGEYYSPENTEDFQTLMYRPLYWYGDRGRPGIDYPLSLGNAPVYSHGDRVITITLKPARWSDGETVSAADVGFWIDLLKANRADWASYVPGGFPDNIASWKRLGPRTIQLDLNASYNPIWFTNNELSQITPLPLAWDRTSLREFTYPTPAADLPAMTPARARAVYAFLNGQAKDLSGYAASPIWSIVDGPWKLQSLTTGGEATFVPNPKYDGPDRPRLAKFVELPFTSETAEFSVLRAGPARGDQSSSEPQISVGYVPDTDVPQAPSLKSEGYRLLDFYPYGFDYFEPNFNNPQVGPILRQLYFRQAFQHLVDQSGWIRAYYQGLGVPTYSPVPAQPANPYADAGAQTNPYPFSVAAARRLLTRHGWKVVSGGLSSCSRAGAGAGECGAGIRAGQRLVFHLLYPSGMSSTDGAMADLQSVARQVGIQIDLKQVPLTTIDSEIEPCSAGSAACDWQLGQYGEAWVFAPDHYPTGEEIFQTGALGNVGNYSDPAVDRLIAATTRTPAAGAQRALNAYANVVREQLPDFWQPSPGTLITVQSNLGGVVPNAYGFINPEEWYFTR